MSAPLYQVAPINSVLRASPDLLAIVDPRNDGVSGVYQGLAPEGYGRPYAVWGVGFGQPENLMGEPPLEDDQRINVDLYAADQPTARKMMQFAVAACETIGDIVGGPFYLYDGDSTKLHRWTFDVSVWQKRM